MGMLRNMSQMGAAAPTSQAIAQPQPQPNAQQGVPAGMGNFGAIFQSLLPMIMNGGLLAPQQNQGQRALNAVNSAGAFNQAPQYNQQMNSMQDATARLGNLSRFGQPSNTMPPSLPTALPSSSATQNSGQAVNNMPAFTGPKISPEGPGFNPPRVPNTAPTMTSQQPAAYNPYQMRTNSAAPGATAQASSQPARPPTSAMSGPMTPAQQYNPSMSQLTPAQRQMQSQQSTMGQRSQAPTNPWARKSLIR